MCLPCLAVALIPFFSGTAAASQPVHFKEPIDALSITMHSEDPAYVRGLQNGIWTDWQPLVINNEQDPALRESDLVLFDVPVSDIEFRGDVPATAVHPIRIANTPVSYKVAATMAMGTPRILSRTDWGADDELLYTDTEHPTATVEVQEQLPAETPTQRETDCAAAQKNFPEEFQTVNKTTKGKNGRTLRWTQNYSKKIRLFTVHHTAILVTGDRRSGAERMRALYQYHSVNRGWGDIGYHYVVDETGQIFEGKAGGPFVIAGHAYCNNVGTIGIALLGNFELEQPAQAQLQSLQRLLKDLAVQYDIDLTKTTTYHGKKLQPIVGHRDLLQTDCPGYYTYGILDQIRANVATGNIDANVTLLPLRSPLPTTPVQPFDPSAPPEEGAEDSSGQAPDRLARLQRKIRTATRLSSKVGGRASRLAAIRQSTSPVQTTAVRPGRPTATYNPNQPSTPIPTEPSRSSVVSSRSSSSKGVVARYAPTSAQPTIKIRLESHDKDLTSCTNAPLVTLADQYRGTVTCTTYNGKAVLINTVGLEDYMMGLAEEPDTEPYEKQRAFAIAARTYAAWYMLNENRKFPGAPYDGSDSPASFQKYVGKTFEAKNPRWVRSVTSTASQVLKKNDQLIKPPYFSSDTGTTRTPAEAGWKNFPFAEIFSAKDDPWCKGMQLAGHGVGMSGCGAKGQAREGKLGEEILQYYYPGTTVQVIGY